MAEEEKAAAAESESKRGLTSTTVVKKRKGVMSRIWNGLFRIRGDDFEKRLQHISKEEAAVLSRIEARSRTSRNITRYVLIFFVVLEVIAIVYAIMMARTVDLDLKMRAFCFLPMFLLPCLYTLIYSGFVKYTKMCDRKDQKTLERLRAERQAKIDELKERTNYYTTQQLIQRYDPDPAAKAAAATVLASKLGADSGLKVFVGDESNLIAATGKSNDVELVQSGGLRNRKQAQARAPGTVSNPACHTEEEMAHSAQRESLQGHESSQLVVQHHDYQASSAYDGGWLSRIAALLVGEDPTQSYALICGNCHMHNGLAQKEDFPFITYYCPHCHALNQPKQSAGHVSGGNTPDLAPVVTDRTVEAVAEASGSPSDSTVTGDSPAKIGMEVGEAAENVVSEEVTS